LLAAIKENNVRFKTEADKISQDMQLFREEFDARLLELTAWEEQIAWLNKQTSLLDKQQKTLVQDARNAVAADINVVRTSLEKKIQDLSAALSSRAAVPATVPPAAPTAAESSGSSNTSITPIVPAESDRPVPQLDTQLNTDSSGISEESLTQ
ncbi:MAG: hypothetical protein MI802_22205, partial [Desulfobacterales bacterium]|nr:hypothetical protein [Desulfobacterales bacterium]